jgi:hypothetical protein
MNAIVIMDLNPSSPFDYEYNIIGVFSNLTKAYNYVYSGKLNKNLNRFSYSKIATYFNSVGTYFNLDDEIGFAKISVNQLVED